MTKALLITSFVLLGSLLAAPLAASNYQSHAPGTTMASLASAPFDHIVTILMENQGLCDVYVGCGGSATYMSQFADQNALVMTWGTTSHPSEGNYISLIGGDNFGHTNDGYCCWGINAPNIVDRMESAGLTWHAFAEDASGSGTCSFNPPRGADHFAFLTFADMNTPARCANFLTATSSSDTEFLNSLNSASPANFIWLTPNDCNNMHDCGIAAGDSYLSTLVPQILSSKEFTTTKATLLIVFDEGYTGCSNTGGTGECVYASFSGPVAKKGLQLSPPGASHYSYLSTIEAAWGLTSLTSKDAGATNMLGAFNAICTTNCPPPPLATSFTTSPSIPLVNVPVAFTATTTGGTAPYAVSWSFGDGASGTGASATHVYTGVGSFTVTETAADSSSSSQTAKSSQTLTITGPLPLSTSFTVLPTSPVVNSLVTFTAVTTGGKSPYTINWNFGDRTTGTGGSITHVYSSAQAFSVTETATDSSSPIQNAVTSQTITISAPPPPSTSFTFLPASPVVNTLVTFTATTIGGTPPYSVIWNFGDGTSGTGTSVAHTFTNAQSFTVKEVATDASTPAQTATSSQLVKVVTTPPLSTTLQVSSSSPQVGETVTFTASATGGTSPYTYAITFGDGVSGTGSITTHAYSIAGSYTVDLTVTDSASPQASIPATTTVEVQALIPPTLSVPANQTITATTWINFTITAASLNTGGTVTLSATGLPTGASFNQTTGVFSWKPSSSQTGSYMIIFTAMDSSDPSTPTSKPMEIQVNQAAPGGSNGGNGGSGGSSNGGCLFCGIIPKISTNVSLLLIGGLLGIVASLALLTIRARASLERTKRRLRI